MRFYSYSLKFKLFRFPLNFLWLYFPPTFFTSSLWFFFFRGRFSKLIKITLHIDGRGVVKMTSFCCKYFVTIKRRFKYNAKLMNCCRRASHQREKFNYRIFILREINFWVAAARVFDGTKNHFWQLWATVVINLVHIFDVWKNMSM